MVLGELTFGSCGSDITPTGILYEDQREFYKPPENPSYLTLASDIKRISYH
jgi:hypothetical protein